LTTIALLPVRYDLLVTRGTDNPFEFEFLNPVTGVAIDLTLATVRLTARESTVSPPVYNGTVKLDKSNTPGSHSAPLAGKTVFTLTRSELTDSPNVNSVSQWLYEVRLYPTGLAGSQQVWFAGNLYLNPTPAP